MSDTESRAGVFIVAAPNLAPGPHCGEPACVPCGEAARRGCYVDAISTEAGALGLVRRLVRRGGRRVTINEELIA